MEITPSGIEWAATDLSNHISCRHLTTLNLERLTGGLAGVKQSFDPLVEILRDRGRVHELAHRRLLESRYPRVVDGGARTEAQMADGADVICQAVLAHGHWHGRADFLIRTDRPGRWAWSYEVVDAKLVEETRAATVLQLCVYSDLLSRMQGVEPVSMHVATPDRGEQYESFRFAEYRAIYRALRSDVEQHAKTTYPDPVAHCDICRWQQHCEGQWRADDHLALVADLGRSHRRELRRQEINTVAALAEAGPPWRPPEYGTEATLERFAQQARLQHAARQHTAALSPYELLMPEPARGLARLPEPSSGDIFLDLEGDPFIDDHGREYLFGCVTADRGYACWWATNDGDERAAFEAVIAMILERWRRDPGMHVYHYATYEPTALKRLAGRYATCAEELDRLLRGHRLIDLHSIVKQSARIGVESYGLKSLESLAGYVRPVSLEITGAAVRGVRLALQRGVPGAIDRDWRESVEAYNRADCEAARAVRDWLEARRREHVETGIEIARPQLSDGRVETEPPDADRSLDVTTRLLDGVPSERARRSDEQEARWILGHAMQWYRREERVTWWEYFRLAELSDEARLDEPRALAGLEHVARTPGRSVPTDRYRFPAQDVQIRTDDELYTDTDLDSKIGSVVDLDPRAQTVSIKRTKKTANIQPTSCFQHKHVKPAPKDAALLRIGEAVLAAGSPSPEQPSIVRDLLLHRPPRGLPCTSGSLRRPDETVLACATRLARSLCGTVLPIQGPPGTGKTWTAARMIVELVRAGRKIGITATSHSIISNLMAEIVRAAHEASVPVRAARKCEASGLGEPGIEHFTESRDAAAKLADLDVLGGTAWLWAREDLRDAVDVLFIDEAGKLALVDALAVSSAARNLVLVGDPLQLEQPIQGDHPDGLAVSVLEHVLGDDATVRPERGLLLDETYRLHPSITAFTSEQFYEEKLVSSEGATRQALRTSVLPQAGLYWHPSEHHGNKSSSTEEAEAVAALIASCCGGEWTDKRGERHTLTPADFLVVAPYNAHVVELHRALVRRGLADVRAGTVDKFQGREAPIAIYSMATSHPDDAPRGLDFLYDRHRLNVATSRAKCASVVVASPELLRPTCKTAQHLRLASALARYVELATRIA